MAGTEAGDGVGGQEGAKSGMQGRAGQAAAWVLSAPPILQGLTAAVVGIIDPQASRNRLHMLHNHFICTN